MNPRRIPFPYPSALGAMLIVAWQFLLLHPGLAADRDWARPLLDEDRLLLGLGLLGLVAAFDLWRFHRAKRRYREQLRQYREQIDELFDARRELGTRARTYSDHADKLKMFISERLLEYIEYDEKFLHFKNIASEVRHNGVISYDRAQTALRRAQQLCPPDDKAQYQEAAEALLYLWDLLDLSTTDNISLHVANRIYDCEEHYFQAQLNPEEAAGAPLQPTFRMSHALGRALLPIVEDPARLKLDGDWGSAWREPGLHADEQFCVLLQGDCEMLGNENHMVLLIENLLNNALFYAQQKAARQRYNPVAIYLGQTDEEVILKVYNRGPQIADSDKDRIYQLGYSSRRIREHHGKGLGLYFVNEITRGFEGRIGFENIDNRADRVTLDVKLANGDLVQEQIDIVDIAGKPMCQLLQTGEQVARRHEWSYDALISSIEVSSQAVATPQLIAGLTDSERSDYIDKADPMRAHWMVEVDNRKRSARLRFVPLDVSGVEFALRFATARSRLDQQD